MGRTAVNVTDAQVDMIREMAAAGRTTQQMASKVGLPAGVVNWQMEKHNIRMNHSRVGALKQNGNQTVSKITPFYRMMLFLTTGNSKLYRNYGNIRKIV